jgi:hypothetical protein
VSRFRSIVRLALKADACASGCTVRPRQRRFVSMRFVLASRRMTAGAATVGLACLLASTSPAEAQQSRAEQLAQEQAKKAEEVRPHTRDRGERLVDLAEDIFISPPKVYPFVGSIYPGGLLAAGPGLRLPYGDTGLLDVHAAWSLKNYKLVDANLKLPTFLGNRFRTDLHAQWMDAPQVAFFGVGNDSLKDDRTSYLYRPTSLGAGVVFEPVTFVSVGGGYQYLDANTGAGKGGTSIEARFTPFDTPALGNDITYNRAHAFAAFDWRESPGYSRSGGLYRVDWLNYTARDGAPFSFRQVDATITQLVPLVRRNFVLGFRALASLTDTDAGDEVPFFLLPDLGGSSELRGYPSWRFRDRNRLLLTGEYRWTPGQFVDMVLFYEAGKVAARRGDLDFDGLKKSYGIGVRFHAPTATALRIELARTSESTSLVFGFGQTF